MYILCVREAHTQDIVSLLLRLPFFQGSQQDDYSGQNNHSEYLIQEQNGLPRPFAAAGKFGSTEHLFRNTFWFVVFYKVILKTSQKALLTVYINSAIVLSN
jgi:hypothetical protein